ncbi:MAG: NAD(P)/FAD-dependent oxidoreductase [Candidatus Binataceae bacterium]
MKIKSADAQAQPIRSQWGIPPWPPCTVGTCPFSGGRETYDVAIVGGGLTGNSVALHLARRGRRVVVFEAGRIGDGASGRSGGLVLEGTARGTMEGASTCLEELARLVYDEALECGLRLPGCWEIAHRPPVKFQPQLPWQDGGSPVSVVHTMAGGVVDPMALVGGLAHAAIKAGAVIHENTPVRHLEYGTPATLELDRGRVRAAHIVVALNAWSTALVPELGAMGSALTLACATAPVEDSLIEEIGLAAGIPFYTIDQPYLWGRLTMDRRIIFGAGLAWGEPEALEWLALEAPAVEECFIRLEGRIRQLHPRLHDLGALTRWGGPISIPDRMTPIIGHLPEAPHIFVAGGYSGHGVALSVHAGRLIAEAITQGAALPKWGAPPRRNA